MFKKSLKVAIAFGVLLAGYAGYVRLFALVAVRVQPVGDRVVPFPIHQSKTKREAIELARRAFGPGSWPADKDLAIRFYNTERGYWMFAQTYERLKDGKVLVFRPFALVWRSRDNKALKTATSDKALITLDQPLSLNGKPGGTSMHVVNAVIEGSVRLRDDKGTPRNLKDDLVVGPMNYIEYDEPTLKIKSESDVVIQDRDLRITGAGLEIDLWPKDEAAPAGKSAGFDGARAAVLKKNVHIVTDDVGGSGILPGPAQSRQRQGTSTPLDLRCAGEMRVYLPRPVLPVRVGPPAPPGPTFAEFSKIVEVARGKLNDKPDFLFCDHLRLILVRGPRVAAPPPEPANAPKPAAATTLARAEPKPKADAVVDEDAERDDDEKEGSGPLTDLVLRRAEATGHSVQLLSPSQGMKVRGVELIHDKLLPAQPDTTYFRGARNTLLQIEKVELVTEGPDKGKVQSVTLIRTVDAKIFQDDRGSDFATIHARGPGQMETRPALNQPVKHTASWQDALTVVTDLGPDKKPRKLIRLFVEPRFRDLEANTSLDARKEAVIQLKPKPKPKVAAAKPNAKAKAKAKEQAQPAASTAENFEIESLIAFENVHLISPDSTLTARDQLEAWFVPAPATTPAPAPKAAAGDASKVADAAAASKVADAAPDAPKGAAEAEPKAAPRPKSTAVANRVWAKVMRGSGTSTGAGRGGGSLLTSASGPGGGKSEVQLLNLIGAVTYHQDPAPGEARGTDVTGEAIDLVNKGEELWRFLVYHRDPTVAKALAARDPIGDELTTRVTPLARVVTKDTEIQGEVVGLDQTVDEAWVIGRGKLVMMTTRGLLADKGVVVEADRAKKTEAKKTEAKTVADSRTKGKAATRAKAKADAEPPKTPMTITWLDGMQFYGLSADPRGRPTARADFFTKVRAQMEDGLIDCQDMKVYMDRPVKLARRKPGDDGEVDGPEAKHDVNLIECYQNVVAITRKVDPVRHVLLQQQRIEAADFLTYDKQSGDFHVPGAGDVYLWNREGENAGASTPGAPGAPASSPAPPRRITPTAGPGRGPVVVGRNSASLPPRAATGAAAASSLKSKTAAANKAPALPLVLTHIKFRDQMKGRFLMGEAENSDPRVFNFFGDVQAVHAKVADTSERINPDHPRAGFSYLTSQSMRFVSEPPPPGSPANTPARSVLQAYDKAIALNDDTQIQADRITYDSLKDFYIAYGDTGDVVMSQQKGAGQPATITNGKAAFYNHKTGEGKIVEPRAVQLIDKGTGVRPYAPPKPAPAPPKPGRKLRGTLRSSVERRGFGGR